MTSLQRYLSPTDKVILFDCVCKLCNTWSTFILKYDSKQVFKLASAQSEAGQAILRHYGYPLDRFDTMLLVDCGVAYSKSAAFLHIVHQLPLPFKLLSVGRIIPRPIRDWLYDRVALNRYRWFGQYEQCVVPRPEHMKRFL